MPVGLNNADALFISCSPLGRGQVAEIQPPARHVVAGVPGHPQELRIDVENETAVQIPPDHADHVRLEHLAEAGLTLPQPLLFALPLGQIAGHGGEVDRLSRRRVVHPEQVVPDGNFRPRDEMLHRQFAGPPPVIQDGGHDDLRDELSLLRHEIIDDLATPHLREVLDADEAHRRPVAVHRVAVCVRDTDEIARVLHNRSEKPPLLVYLLAVGDVAADAEYAHEATAAVAQGCL